MMKRNKFATAILLTTSLWSFAAVSEEISTNAALMQAMDKVTGRVNKITVPVRSKITFGDFSLVLRACKKRPAEETPENFAFIDVADKSFGTDEYNIFRGWIISSTPGISAIEHPIYDVWLLECVDTENIDKSALLTEEDLKVRDELPAKTVFADKNDNDDEDKIAKEEEIKEPKVIHIKEFINEDRNSEKTIKEVPTYISESSTTYVSDIEEGEEPQNLLQFTTIQEAESEKAEKSKLSVDDDLTKAIDAEINSLKN